MRCFGQVDSAATCAYVLYLVPMCTPYMQDLLTLFTTCCVHPLGAPYVKDGGRQHRHTIACRWPPNPQLCWQHHSASGFNADSTGQHHHHLADPTLTSIAVRLAPRHPQHPGKVTTGAAPVQWMWRGSTIATFAQPRSSGQDRQHTNSRSAFETLLLNPRGL
jgi:hypothetical protein